MDFTEAVLGTLIRLIAEDEPLASEEAGSRLPSNLLLDRKLSLLRGTASIVRNILRHYQGMLAGGRADAALGNGPAPADVKARASPDSQAANSSANDVALPSINPFKLFSDLKEYIVGGSGDAVAQKTDPRKEALSSLFLMLPRVISAIMDLWPSWSRLASHLHQNEGSTAQRTAINSILEPVLRKHTVDLFAAIVGYRIEQSYASKPHSLGEDGFKELLDLLTTMRGSSPTFIVNAICDVFEVSLHWDESSANAIAGKHRRQKKEQDKKTETSNPEEEVQADKAKVPLSASQQSAVSAGSTTKFLFVAADFFAEYSPVDVQIASLDLLQTYIATRENSDDVADVWTPLSAQVVALSTQRVKPSVVLGMLSVVSTFATKAPQPLPDRRQRKDMVTATTLLASICVNVASGILDPNSIISEADGPDSDGALTKRASTDSKPSASSADKLPETKRLHLISKGMTSLARSFLPLLDVVFAEDRPAGVAVLSPAADTANKVLRSHSRESEAEEQAQAASAKFLHSCRPYGWALQAIQRHMLGLIEDSSIFERMSIEILEVLAQTAVSILNTDKSLLSQIGGGGSNAGGNAISAVFAGRDAELTVRARAIHRTAFCIFFGENDHFTAQVSGVLEKLRDSLRVRSRKLTTVTFLCLRVLLLRTGSNSVAPFRASIIAELVRILEDPYSDPNETISALRFIDLIFLLKVPEFAYEQCFFFLPAGTPFEDGHQADFEPLVTRIANSEDEGFDLSGFGHFRVSSLVTVVGGPLESASPEMVKAYAVKLCQRLSICAQRLSEPDLATINSELRLEFEHGAV